MKLDIQTQALKRRYQSASPPELWLWLVVLVVILGLWIECWYSSS